MDSDGRPRRETRVSWSPSLGISTRLACTPPREASQHHEQHPPGCLLNAHQTRIHDEEPSGAAGVGGRRGEAGLRALLRPGGRDLCDIPTSLLSPLLAAKRRSGRDSSSGMSHVRLPPAHGGRERAEADRIWEARAPETCQIRSVAAIPRTAATGSGVSQLPWPPPRLSSPPPRRFARLSSSAAITLQGERHARQVRGSPDGYEKERK